jgi:SAM-dependent methyltransferase
MRAVGAALAAEGLQVAEKPLRRRATGAHCITLRCPECKTDVVEMPYHELAQTREALQCRRCVSMLTQKEGIWLALRHERQKYFARFTKEYEFVRRAEQRGSDDPEFYLSLPYCDRMDRNAWQWAIRAKTYNYIERKILPDLHGADAQSLAVLDLGAGNGWLSYRLARLGHRSVAVDLQTNIYDGLGAGMHYQSVLPILFPRVQAELDHLPLADEQFDCAIFNASFHYSENYDCTLAEAIRCLRPGGTVMIADSPYYRREESGMQMLAERRKSFEESYGFASNGLASLEFLTRERLLALEARHDIEWRVHRVWYGTRWAMRPVVAKLRKRREPSRFRIYTAQVKAQ